MVYEKESYAIIGILFEVYNNLGSGFLEIVYKDALEYEFNQRKINFEREKEYKVQYKDIFLPHKFYADFVVFDKIILEVKCVQEFSNKHFAQCLNYLSVSGEKLCILTNFQNQSLEYKRFIL